MIRTAAMHHTSFTVSNMDRSLRFYRDLLGMEVLVDQTPDADYLGQIVGYPELRLHTVFLAVPGHPECRLELNQYLNHQGQVGDLATNRPGSAHVAFLVDDIQGFYRELLALGVRFKSPPVPITAGTNRGAFAAYFADPDGIPLEVMQPAPHV
ncbi:MAG: VOC family protein [Chloroflexota bacterium]